MKKILAVSVVLVIFTTLTGCSKKDPQIVSNENDQVVATAIPSTIPTPVRRVQDCFVVANDQLPSNWPDDIPFYVNSRLTSVKCAPNDSDMYEVRLESTDSFESIVDFFADQVNMEGWLSASFEDTGPYVYAAYKSMNAKKPGRELILDLRHSGNNLSTGTTEIIYRERSY